MLIALKSELEKKVGFAIDSFKNCRRLENLLQQKGLYISYSSLARIFSIGNKTTQPRKSTLNELSVFLGYQSYEHFKKFFENSSEELEAYTRKVLEMKSELFFGDRLEGLELFIDIRKNHPDHSGWLCQDIALFLFNNQQLPQKELEHIVEKGIAEVNFMDYFIYEDDPFGHYEWFINHASKSEKQSQEFKNFQKLFLERKKLLRGNISEQTQIPSLNINQSVHLFSRVLEIEVLQMAVNQPKNLVDFYQEKLDHTIKLLENRHEYDKIIVLGRFFRAACHTGIDKKIKLDDGTKQFCVDIINSNGMEFEFIAPIYAFLKNDPTLKLSLAFYHNNYWKNAQFESEMLIAKALGLKKVFETYKIGVSR
ncbi:MAG: hypothetical protein RLZ10_2753 [Bacteroidota bacterium]|jgi:hypothetical protein